MAHNDDQYAEHFDAGHSGKEHHVHQRLRANSTIMELKKILGAFGTPTSNIPHPALHGTIECFEFADPG